eukprot:4568926-Pyramimonas_sp.AAC.1
MPAELRSSIMFETSPPAVMSTTNDPPYRYTELAARRCRSREGAPAAGGGGGGSRRRVESHVSHAGWVATSA